MNEGGLGSPVLVTGGSGFLGRNLIRALLNRHVDVRALVRSERAAGIVERLGAVPVIGDVDDPSSLAPAMDGMRAVFHSAAYVGQWGPPEVFERVNVQGTKNVLSAARKHGATRFLHVSTEAVLSDGRPIVQADETTPIPVSPLPGYPSSKAAAESAVLAANAPGFATIIIRPRFIWGRDDTTLLPDFAQAVTTGRFAWIGGGHYLTSTCHVVNACHGAILAAESGRAGGVYFLTDGKPVEMRAFLTALLQTRGLSPGNRSVPLWVARSSAYIGELACNTLALEGPPAITRTAVALIGQEVTVRDDLARRELRYAPVMTREEGLKELTTGRWKEALAGAA